MAASKVPQAERQPGHLVGVGRPLTPFPEGLLLHAGALRWEAGGSGAGAS